MSRLHVVEEPKARREPTLLSFIGLIVVVGLAICIPELIVKTVVGEWLVNAFWRMVGVTAIFVLAWRWIGWAL